MSQGLGGLPSFALPQVADVAAVAQDAVDLAAHPSWSLGRVRPAFAYQSGRDHVDRALVGGVQVENVFHIAGFARLDLHDASANTAVPTVIRQTLFGQQ